MAERYITLAIHTYTHAVTLRRILESHGVAVKFENLVISGAGIASGVRVKIKETDLPLALKITESGDSFPAAKMELKMAGMAGTVLIPVDFSPNSLLACHAGFDLAKKLNLQPVILHAYVTPYFAGNMSYADSTDSGLSPVFGLDTADIEEEIDMRKESSRLMGTFRRKLDDMLEKENIADVGYSVIMSEGIPEEAILEYCRLTPPSLVVMATRGVDKKGEQLIGSVTAEVLDSCRVPVFTIPENFNFTSVDSLKKLVFFCNLDQHDILSVDTLMRMFDYPDVEVTLVPVNERVGEGLKDRVNQLRDFFNKSYPAAKFSAEIFPQKSFREDFENYERQSGVQLFIVPNRKRNIFSRLFNPGMAHKLLFEKDIPLLALPV